MVRSYGHRVTVELVEITDDDLERVVAIRLAPGQERVVTTVADSLAEAATCRARAARPASTSGSAFVPRGDLDPDGEVVLRLDLHRQVALQCRVGR